LNDVRLFLPKVKAPLIVATHHKEGGIDESIRRELGAKSILHMPNTRNELEMAIKQALA